MRYTTTNSTFQVVLLGAVALISACLADPDAGPGGDSCRAASVEVNGMIVHDARDGGVKDSAFVNLNEAANPERPAECEATVELIVGSTRTTLQETRPGQYEAGYSEIVAGLPPLTLSPGGEHRLEVDLDADGSVDVTGVVILSDVTEFRATRATATEAEFAWSDAGQVGGTTYYVQASDERDFVFPDNFATGYVEGSTVIRFGGGSEWPYFTADGPLYARIQAETEGSLSSSGRFTAWEWPVEPILQY